MSTLVSRAVAIGWSRNASQDFALLPAERCGQPARKRGLGQLPGHVLSGKPERRRRYILNPLKVLGIFCTAAIVARRTVALVPGEKSSETVSTMPP
jgi:hypothetical protein